MHFRFMDLVNWARSRDFDQLVDKDSIYGFPADLTDLAKFPEIGQSRPRSGARTGLNVKEGGRALKIRARRGSWFLTTGMTTWSRTQCIG